MRGFEKLGIVAAALAATALTFGCNESAPDRGDGQTENGASSAAAGPAGRTRTLVSVQKDDANGSRKAYYELPDGSIQECVWNYEGRPVGCSDLAAQ